MTEKHRIVFGWSKSKNRPTYEVEIVDGPNGTVDVMYEGSVVASGPNRTSAVQGAIGVFQQRQRDQKAADA